MKFNINGYIKFKLTKRGKKVLKIWVEENFKLFEELKMCRDLNKVSETFIKPIGKGYYEAQMWEFMNIFGRHMGMGFDNVIEESIIELEEESK